MRAIQKVIITVYCILVAVACIYVPWRVNFNTRNFSLGYSLIWKPLSFEKIVNVSVIDYQRIIFELLAITAVFAIFFVLTIKPKKVLPRS